jgi:hypothetical protein
MTLHELAPDEMQELAQRAEQRVGRVLRNRWRLEELIRVDASVAVYAATHRMGKRVEITMLHPELSRRSEARQRFVDEGYTFACGDHPGADSILDDDVAEDGAIFLVTELDSGASLDEFVPSPASCSPITLSTAGARVPRAFAGTETRSPRSPQKHGRTAFAVAAGLFIATIGVVGRMKKPEIGRSAQAVLVSPVLPAPGHASQPKASDRCGSTSAQNLPNADADCDLSGAQRSSEQTTIEVSCSPRTNGTKVVRSLPKADARPSEAPSAHEVERTRR